MTVYHATLYRAGVQIDCTEIDENNITLAKELFREFGHDLTGTTVILEARIGE